MVLHLAFALHRSGDRTTSYRPMREQWAEVRRGDETVGWLAVCLPLLGLS